MPEPKPAFLERMKLLLPDKGDYENYLKIIKTEPPKSLRCNTLKTSPEELKEKLKEKGWKIEQPWKTNPEVMILNSTIAPGEFGRSLEHQLGYYYIQELASLLPIIALKLKQGDFFLDLCAAPGSKTTQAAAEMKNTGTIIGNEVSLGRLRILATNTERCGVTNLIITKKEGVSFLKRTNLIFDKILIDAPCSGEGTLRSSPRTAIMWNPNTIKALSKLQMKMVEAAIPKLKVGGEMVYSTCTHAPEENEEVVDYVLSTFKDKIKIEKIELPVKTRDGIIEWKGKQFNPKVKLTCRIYPHDNNTEGFFLAKFKKVKE